MWEKIHFFKLSLADWRERRHLEAGKFSVNKANGCSKAHFLVNAQRQSFLFAVQASYYIILQRGDF